MRVSLLLGSSWPFSNSRISPFPHGSSSHKAANAAFYWTNHMQTRFGRANNALPIAALGRGRYLLALGLEKLLDGRKRGTFASTTQNRIYPVRRFGTNYPLTGVITWVCEPTHILVGLIRGNVV